MAFKKIVLNIPHCYDTAFRAVEWDKPEEIQRHMREWTDWHTEKIFAPRIDGTKLEERIVKMIYPYSRFYVDVERLIDDPMEEIGQGIIYTRFGEASRTLTPKEIENRMITYHDYLRGFGKWLDEDTILVDCHSFPSRLCPDIDICIGFNDDESKPDERTLEGIADIFRSHGFRVGFNTPFSNSLTPVKPINYKSVMIEVNKKVYMSEYELFPLRKAHRVNLAINLVYRSLLLGLR